MRPKIKHTSGKVSNTATTKKTRLKRIVLDPAGSLSANIVKEIHLAVVDIFGKTPRVVGAQSDKKDIVNRSIRETAFACNRAEGTSVKGGRQRTGIGKKGMGIL